MSSMLWLSAMLMAGLTMFAWWKAQQHKSGLRKAYLAAMVCGIIGTLIFVTAALI
jgi:hypothetical protein